MNTVTETATEYIRVALHAAERDDPKEALYHLERAVELLLRQPTEIEAPGTVVGESVRYSHLGRVLAEKARRRFA